MSRCIYCGKSEPEVYFNDEHVIPKFLGGFEPLNPKLKKQNKLVCYKCNSQVFSALEAIFKEDSEEGLFAQQLNLVGSNSIRIQGKRLRIGDVQGFGKSFLSEIFPFLKLEEEKFVVDLKPQIKIRNYADGYQVFLVEALQQIKDRNGSKFKKVKERLSKVKKTDISIIAGGDSKDDDVIDDIINLLKDYGVSYNEKDRNFEHSKKIAHKKWEAEFHCTVDHDIGRVLAKIIFNYFTYCALQEQQQDIVFRHEFKKIRRFIGGDDKIPLKDIVISFDKDHILEIDKEKGQRLVAHTVVFESTGNKIIGKLALFGKHVYEIAIGDLSTCLNKDGFGCGHVFNPFQRSIHNLSQKFQANPTKEDLRATFGLFKRFR